MCANSVGCGLYQYPRAICVLGNAAVGSRQSQATELGSRQNADMSSFPC